MYTYAWTADPDDDIPVDLNAANDNIKAGLDAILPANVDTAKARFWTKLIESTHAGRLGRMRNLVKNASLLFDVLVDPTFAIPWGTTTGIAFTLAYFISSLDVIPDAIPVIGFIDDAWAVAEVAYMFSSDIQRYEATRHKRPSRRFSKAA